MKNAIEDKMSCAPPRCVLHSSTGNSRRSISELMTLVLITLRPMTVRRSCNTHEKKEFDGRVTVFFSERTGTFILGLGNDESDRQHHSSSTER